MFPKFLNKHKTEKDVYIVFYLAKNISFEKEPLQTEKKDVFYPAEILVLIIGIILHIM